MFRIGQEEKDAVARVIDSKQLFKINNGAKEVFHFQEELQEKLDAKHTILMSSGQAALITGLIAMGIGPGDQVIVPAYTYIASAMAIIAAGAIPVIAEIDESLTLDPRDVERKITPYTKAIMPVHIQGYPSKMDEILEIADRHGLKIIEDSCQADGGSYKGKRLGTIGDVGVFSFNFYKVITCGDGGALITNNSDIHQKALIYHDSSAVCFFGEQLDGSIEPFGGVEYRSHEIVGAIMREQLKRLDGILTDLRAVKKRIVDGIKDKCRLNPINDSGECGSTLSLIFESEEKARAFKEALSQASEGRVGATVVIDTGKHVYSNWSCIMNKKGALHPLMDPFKMEANKDIIPDYKPDMCPVTLDILSRTVHLGLNPDFSDESIELIISSICKAADNI